MSESTAEISSISEAIATVKSKRFYAPELDMLRFFAFMCVFFRHVVTGYGDAVYKKAEQKLHVASIPIHPHSSFMHRLPGCLDFGVCLFFFLSSYLITKLLLIEREATGTVHIRDFYIRRSIRIWPLYFVFLGVMAIAAVFFPILKITFPRVLASFFFVANWPIVVNGWMGSPIEPLWSVSVEEQFYLIWPNFAKRGRSGILLISGLLLILSVATLLYIGFADYSFHYSASWINTLVQSLFFAGGALAALFLPERNRDLHALPRILIFAAGIGAWGVAAGFFQVVNGYTPHGFSLLLGYLLILLGTLMIFLAALGQDVSGAPKAISYLGKISYGLYVFHTLFLKLSLLTVAYLLADRLPLVALHLCGGTIALAITVTCAWASYEYLEVPFLKLKKRFTVVASRPI
jgi:peptidoglycan/LPS O-acetylase OafA/YrhL